jgi:hypothetical protein
MGNDADAFGGPASHGRRLGSLLQLNCDRHRPAAPLCWRFLSTHPPALFRDSIRKGRHWKLGFDLRPGHTGAAGDTIHPDAADFVYVDPDLKRQPESFGCRCCRLQGTQHRTAVELIEGRTIVALGRIQMSKIGQKWPEALCLPFASIGQPRIGDSLTCVGEGVVERFPVADKEQIHVVLEALVRGE